MMVVGDADIWSDTFPDALIPRVLDLVTDVWDTFEKPGPADLEVQITQRFKHALKQAKDLRLLPVRIEREPAEDHPVTGIELGRIDLKFVPAVSAREEVYFAFECKRLNVVDGSRRRTLAPEYVTEGMMRFVTGQYASSVGDGGMIGYVLDGHCDQAIARVGQHVASRAAELLLAPSTSMARSSVRPEKLIARETQHDAAGARRFRLHHLFLGRPTDGDRPSISGPTSYDDTAVVLTNLGRTDA